MSDEFIERLKLAFGHGSMADIARRLELPHATIRNYFGGRLPAPDVLIKIANETNVSLNWLLLGTGDMYVRGGEPLDLGKLIDRRIEQVVERMLLERAADEIQNLGSIDDPPPFDVESALARFSDPQRVMGEWFRHEGREYPEDFGVVFFQGWESFSDVDKIEAIMDAKKVLDRTLKVKREA